jgi:hypothetical protein
MRVRKNKISTHVIRLESREGKEIQRSYEIARSGLLSRKI